MTPDPASAGSDRSSVAAKPPEPIQNWLLIFARGFTRPTGTSARVPKFTTPSNPFAPKRFIVYLLMLQSLPLSYQAGLVSSRRYTFTAPLSVVHCAGFAKGLSWPPSASNSCGSQARSQPRTWPYPDAPEQPVVGIGGL